MLIVIQAKVIEDAQTAACMRKADALTPLWNPASQERIMNTIPFRSRRQNRRICVTTQGAGITMITFRRRWGSHQAGYIQSPVSVVGG